MKVYLESNSCIRRNSEIIKLKTYFNLNHIQIIDKPKNADYIVLSTCAFKEEEENYSLSRLRYLKKFPGKMLVLGCLPDIAPARFDEFNGTPHIAPRELGKIDSFFAENKIKYFEIDDTNIIPKNISVSSMSTAIQKLRNDFEFTSEFRSRIIRYLEKKFKTFFKMGPNNFYLNTGRGCLGSCTYCAIRRAIGKLESRPIEGIIDQFHQGLEKGFKDFVILGDDVGAYGVDRGQTFPELMSRLVKELNAMTGSTPENKNHLADVRFHIQEIHPHWLVRYKQEMLELIKTKKIKSILCPIESGNDRVLDLMKRRYNVDEISAFFREARSIFPEIIYSTHIMAGFPSETKEEFEDSLRAAARIHFDHVTIFPYDPKEGTPASNITPQIDKQTIQKRLRLAQQFFKHAGIKTYLSCPD